MADLLTLNCPTCGGQLQVTNDVDRFVCARCGNTHMIDPGKRMESLAGELDKMRLVMDIRDAEDSLAVLCKRKSVLERLVDQHLDERRFWRFLNIAFPVGTVIYGVYEGASVIWALFLAALLCGFLLLIYWVFPVSSRIKNEQSELRRLNDHIKSGDRTLSFLKQELQRVTGQHQIVKGN